MCIKSLLTGRHGSSAKVADGRLILSLPDAETPVIWVMDLVEASTAIIRLEMDKQGHSILKKYGNKTAAETVAVYRNRKDAERSLVKAANALEKAKDSRLRVGPNNQPVIIRKSSLISRLFTAFLYIWFAGYLCINLLGITITNVPPQNMAAQQSASTDLNAAGVPLSADEFLKKKETQETPK